MYSDQERRAIAVMDVFQAGWEALDKNLILSVFAQDSMMHTMMKAPYRTKAEIADMLDGFLATASSVRMEVLNRCIDGNVVTLERRDHFTVQGKSGVLPAVGIFEIEGDKIRVWREYFDWNYFAQQLED